MKRSYLAAFFALVLVIPSLAFAHGVVELVSFLQYVFLQGLGLAIAIAALVFFFARIVWKFHGKWMSAALVVFALSSVFFAVVAYGLPQGMQYPVYIETYGPGKGANLPFGNVFRFFQHLDDFKRIDDIAADPNAVPPPLVHTQAATSSEALEAATDTNATSSDTAADTGDVVEVHLTTTEVLAEMAPGVTMNYWTFDDQVPGPMLRVKEGDTVKLTLTNDATSLHHHNIDLHAVTGPGGGAAVTHVGPGETKTFSFKALHPGLYVYHCAVENVPSHMTHGMYGMILVEPEGGLPPVDKEFYVMQGEFYSTGGIGKKGLQIFDTKAMLAGEPNYVVFNGRTGGVTDKMHAEVGDRVRIYFGNGGVNHISSFHVIGEVFDRVYPEGAVGSEPHENIQTTTVPAGGATIVEFGVEYPGNYILVDHALARLDKGAWGVLEVSGEADPAIFEGDFGHADDHEH